MAATVVILGGGVGGEPRAIEQLALERREEALAERTPAKARLAVFDFIEGWYHPRRRHSALDYP
jgi:transposase InsO family protein